MSEEQQQNVERLGDDLLFGTRKIAEFLELTENEADWHMRKGHISYTRMGKIKIASKTALRRKFAPDTAA